MLTHQSRHVLPALLALGVVAAGAAYGLSAGHNDEPQA